MKIRPFLLELYKNIFEVIRIKKARINNDVILAFLVLFFKYSSFEINNSPENSNYNAGRISNTSR